MKKKAAGPTPGRKGRPTRFRESMIREIEEFTAKGMTIDEIAMHYSVDRVTIYRWAKKYEGVKQALKLGRDMQIERVVESLFRRASGYDYEEVKKIVESTLGKNGNEARKHSRIETTTKHVPADIGAAAFLLKNLQPERFRDKHDIEHSGEMKLTYDNLVIREELDDDDDEEGRGDVPTDTETA